MKKSLGAIVMMLVFTVSFSQTITQHRFEAEHKFTDSDYSVFSAKEDGLVVFRETDDYEKGDKFWEILILDTLLEVRYEHRILLDSDFELIGYDVSRDQFGLLYREGVDPKNNFHLLAIDLYDERYSIHEIENEIEINLTHFIMVDRHVVLGGTVVNKPTLIHYSVDSEKVKVLPGLYRTDTEIVDIQPNLNGTFNVVFIEAESSKDNQKVIIRVFSPSGEILLESSADFPENYRVHAGTTNHLEGKDLIIVGTYGEKNNKLSQGIFYINVRPENQNNVKLIEYVKLQQFFQYLGDRREKRIMEKIDDSGPHNPYEFRTHFNVWELEEIDGRFYIYGEVIDPQYNTSPPRPYGSYPYTANNIYNTYDRFGGFGRYYTTNHSLVNRNDIVSVKYRSGVIICLNSNGNVVNDFSLEIENMESGTMEQLAGFSIFNNKYHIIYKDEEELYRASMDLDNYEIQDSTMTIVSPLEHIIIKDESIDGKIERWYDNLFFIWGYERLKSSESNDRKRVFYINKVHVN